jgi:hypothetical protein
LGDFLEKKFAPNGRNLRPNGEISPNLVTLEKNKALKNA